MRTRGQLPCDGDEHEDTRSRRGSCLADRLAAIERALAYDFPTADIDRMLAEIEADRLAGVLDDDAESET
jgi:hypothetical protein